jgi:hypothetical protein
LFFVGFYVNIDFMSAPELSFSIEPNQEGPTASFRLIPREGEAFEIESRVDGPVQVEQLALKGIPAMDAKHIIDGRTALISNYVQLDIGEAGDPLRYRVPSDRPSGLHAWATYKNPSGKGRVGLITEEFTVVQAA